MGCGWSQPHAPKDRQAHASSGKHRHRQKHHHDTRVASFRKPKWKSNERLTTARLQALREEFWDTQPHYGGSKEIWDALKASCEADLDTAKLIIESAEIIVAAPDMTVCYDQRGYKYDLPKYVLSAPTNLVGNREEGP